MNRLRVRDKEDLSLEVRVKEGPNQEVSTKMMISMIMMTTNTSKTIMGVDRANQKV